MKTLASAALVMLIPAAALAAQYEGSSTDRNVLMSAVQAPARAGKLGPMSQYLGEVIFTCVNADAAGTGAHILDRDNTGLGQEAMRIDITDGDGTLIYQLSFSNVLGTFAGGIGDFFYTIPPTHNPLRFVLTSLAGNGFAEQIDVDVQGECPGLPSAYAGLDVPTLSTVGTTLFVLAVCAAAVVALRRRRLAS